MFQNLGGEVTGTHKFAGMDQDNIILKDTAQQWQDLIKEAGETETPTDVDEESESNGFIGPSSTTRGITAVVLGAGAAGAVALSSSTAAASTLGGVGAISTAVSTATGALATVVTGAKVGIAVVVGTLSSPIALPVAAIVGTVGIAAGLAMYFSGNNDDDDIPVAELEKETPTEEDAEPVEEVTSLEELEKGINIGRSSGSDLIIPNNAISREHAIIRLVDGKVILADLGSTYGTYVNGERIDEPVEVNAEDEIILTNEDNLPEFDNKIQIFWQQPGPKAVGADVIKPEIPMAELMEFYLAEDTIKILDEYPTVKQRIAKELLNPKMRYKQLSKLLADLSINALYFEKIDNIFMALRLSQLQDDLAPLREEDGLIKTKSLTEFIEEKEEDKKQETQILKTKLRPDVPIVEIDSKTLNVIVEILNQPENLYQKNVIQSLLYHHDLIKNKPGFKRSFKAILGFDEVEFEISDFGKLSRKDLKKFLEIYPLGLDQKTINLIKMHVISNDALSNSGEQHQYHGAIVDLNHMIHLAKLNAVKQKFKIPQIEIEQLDRTHQLLELQYQGQIRGQDKLSDLSSYEPSQFTQKDIYSRPKGVENIKDGLAYPNTYAWDAREVLIFDTRIDPTYNAFIEDGMKKVEEAREEKGEKLTDQEKISILFNFVNQKVKSASSSKNEINWLQDRLEPNGKGGQIVRIGEIIELGLGVCRHKAALLYKLLETAKIKNIKLSRGDVRKQPKEIVELYDQVSPDQFSPERKFMGRHVWIEYESDDYRLYVDPMWGKIDLVEKQPKAKTNDNSDGAHTIMAYKGILDDLVKEYPDIESLENVINDQGIIGRKGRFADESFLLYYGDNEALTLDEINNKYTTIMQKLMRAYGGNEVVEEEEVVEQKEDEQELNDAIISYPEEELDIQLITKRVNEGVIIVNENRWNEQIIININGDYKPIDAERVARLIQQLYNVYKDKQTFLQMLRQSLKDIFVNKDIDCLLGSIKCGSIGIPVNAENFGEEVKDVVAVALNPLITTSLKETISQLLSQDPNDLSEAEVRLALNFDLDDVKANVSPKLYKKLTKLIKVLDRNKEQLEDLIEEPGPQISEKEYAVLIEKIKEFLTSGYSVTAKKGFRDIDMSFIVEGSLTRGWSNYHQRPTDAVIYGKKHISDLDLVIVVEDDYWNLLSQEVKIQGAIERSIVLGDNNVYLADTGLLSLIEDLDKINLAKRRDREVNIVIIPKNSVGDQEKNGKMIYDDLGVINLLDESQTAET